MSFWDMKLKQFGGWIWTTFNPRTLPATTSTAIQNYRAKYVTCKNARMTPFFHCVAVCILLNYMIEFKHLRKHESLRKYH